MLLLSLVSTPLREKGVGTRWNVWLQGYFNAPFLLAIAGTLPQPGGHCLSSSGSPCPSQTQPCSAGLRRTLQCTPRLLCWVLLWTLANSSTKSCRELTTQFKTCAMQCKSQVAIMNHTSLSVEHTNDIFLSRHQRVETQCWDRTYVHGTAVIPPSEGHYGGSHIHHPYHCTH